MCINAYIYIYIHTCTYICIYMSAHIHIYTYIHTRIQNVHMNARKARLKQRCGSDCAGAQLDAKKLCPSPCPLQSRGEYPSWPAARQLPVHEERRISAEQPQPTAAHRTITTARRLDHIRSSALVRSRSIRGNPSSGSVNQSLRGSWALVIPSSVRSRVKGKWLASLLYLGGVSI